MAYKKKGKKKVPRPKPSRYFGEINVAVGIPSGESWSAEFGMSLANLCSYYGRVRAGGCAVQRMSIINTRGAMLCQSRESLLSAAIKRVEATHILWLDADMTFPPNTLHLLLDAGKDFVAAQGVTKSIPAEPVAQALGGGRTYSDKGRHDLEIISHVGLAVALLKLTDGVKALKPPLFPMEWIEERDSYAGEDVFFCHKLRADLGMDIWLDHGLSRQIGHVGTLRFNHDLVGSVEERRVA